MGSHRLGGHVRGGRPAVAGIASIHPAPDQTAAADGPPPDGPPPPARRGPGATTATKPAVRASKAPAGPRTRPLALPPVPDPVPAVPVVPAIPPGPPSGGKPTRRRGAVNRRRRRVTALLCVLAVVIATIGITFVVTAGASPSKRSDAQLIGSNDGSSAKTDGSGLGQALGKSPVDSAANGAMGGAAGQVGGRRVGSPPSKKPVTAAPAPATSTAPVTGSSPINTNGTFSGLPWLSGVWVDNSLSGSLGFGTWRNRPLDTILLYTARDQGWNGIVQPNWPVTTFASFPGRLILSVPPYPQGGGSNAACATGSYDSQWKTFGSYLVAHQRANTIVRLGWEFNGSWFYWNTGSDPTNFKSCYQHIANAIRSTDPRALMDWTFTAHAASLPAGGSAYSAYPGDAYVDIIGIDSYDMWPASHSAAAFNSQCSGANGLCGAINFARAHGKKVGVGEWGVASCNQGGGGDNPLYIAQMYARFMANKDVMAYEAYFDDSTAGNVCSSIVNGKQNPKAAAQYKALFGRP